MLRRTYRNGFPRSLAPILPRNLKVDMGGHPWEATDAEEIGGPPPQEDIMDLGANIGKGSLLLGMNRASSIGTDEALSQPTSSSRSEQPGPERYSKEAIAKGNHVTTWLENFRLRKNVNANRPANWRSTDKKMASPPADGHQDQVDVFIRSADEYEVALREVTLELHHAEGRVSLQSLAYLVYTLAAYRDIPAANSLFEKGRANLLAACDDNQLNKGATNQERRDDHLRILYQAHFTGLSEAYKTEDMWNLYERMTRTDFLISPVCATLLIDHFVHRLAGERSASASTASRGGSLGRAELDERENLFLSRAKEVFIGAMGIKDSRTVGGGGGGRNITSMLSAGEQGEQEDSETDAENPGDEEPHMRSFSSTSSSSSRPAMPEASRLAYWVTSPPIERYVLNKISSDSDCARLLESFLGLLLSTLPRGRTAAGQRSSFQTRSTLKNLVAAYLRYQRANNAKDGDFDETREVLTRWLLPNASHHGLEEEARDLWHLLVSKAHVQLQEDVLDDQFGSSRVLTSWSWSHQLSFIIRAMRKTFVRKNHSTTSIQTSPGDDSSSPECLERAFRFLWANAAEAIALDYEGLEKALFSVGDENLMNSISKSARADSSGPCVQDEAQASDGAKKEAVKAAHEEQLIRLYLSLWPSSTTAASEGRGKLRDEPTTSKSPLLSISSSSASSELHGLTSLLNAVLEFHLGTGQTEDGLELLLRWQQSPNELISGILGSHMRELEDVERARDVLLLGAAGRKSKVTPTEEERQEAFLLSKLRKAVAGLNSSTSKKADAPKNEKQANAHSSNNSEKPISMMLPGPTLFAYLPFLTFFHGQGMPKRFIQLYGVLSRHSDVLNSLVELRVRLKQDVMRERQKSAGFRHGLVNADGAKVTILDDFLSSRSTREVPKVVDRVEGLLTQLGRLATSGCVKEFDNDFGQAAKTHFKTNLGIRLDFEHEDDAIAGHHDDQHRRTLSYART
ncbi:unnamed protein product [Amoebophrya sp. A25]|nr:unnamed protein product [Amoebophrya sp. A25]|eukprot:GSA25T00025630001.1